MAKDAVEWLATVSKHCRKMIELAGLAIRDADEYETAAARDSLREALKVNRDALQVLLPEDFPRSRIGDLNRHIGFCEPNDWNDTVLADVPDILSKAETYAVKNHGDRTGALKITFMRVSGPDWSWQCRRPARLPRPDLGMQR